MYKEIKENLEKICLEEDYQVEADNFLKDFIGDINSPSVYTVEEDNKRNKNLLKFINR